MTTPLADRLVARITATGPITVAEYMAECLLDPEHGYYATRDPLGAAGDFTTAPEISQMFGEVLGLALAQAWLDQGAPARIHLVELGPGRGTLMADILRATARVPGFAAAARVTLVEASPTLKALQAETLRGQVVHWARTLEDVAQDAPLFVVANEFFDALPIRQFQREGDLWRERVIGVREDALQFGLSGPISSPELDRRIDARTGDIVELRPTAAAIMARIGAQIVDRGGAAILIDYGDAQALGDTFQAVKAHAYVNPLIAPGEADLTAHVDFTALGQAALPALPSVVTPQGVFLERLGITARAQTLATKLNGTALDQHIAAHRRLTHPKEMGTLFKVLGIVPPGAAPVPGTEYPKDPPQ